MAFTMSEDADADPAHPEGRPAAANRNLDPIDQPPRRLGSKRLALQEQRQRQRSAARISSLDSSDGCTQRQVIASADGILAFAVVRTSRGLLIERRRWPASGLRTAQTMVFDNVRTFDRWCDTEPVRFEDPQLHTQLRREGHAMLDDGR